MNMTTRRVTTLFVLAMACFVPSLSNAQLQLIPWLARALLGVGERSTATELAAAARTARASEVGMLIRAESSEAAAARTLRKGERLEKTQNPDIYKIIDATNKVVKIVDFARKYSADQLISCGNGLYAENVNICQNSSPQESQQQQAQKCNTYNIRSFLDGIHVPHFGLSNIGTCSTFVPDTENMVITVELSSPPALQSSTPFSIWLYDQQTNTIVSSCATVHTTDGCMNWLYSQTFPQWFSFTLGADALTIQSR